MSKNLKLIKTNIESFGGIDSSKPILLFFDDNKNIITAEGNQGVGKTSFINALLYALGQSFDIKEENFINLNDNKIKIEQEFEVDGQKYRVNATKSKFELAILQDIGGKERYLPIPEPINTLRQLVGYVGVSPMSLKSKSGAEQVKELRKALSISNDIDSEEDKIKKAFNEAKNARTEFNRELERLRKILSENPLFLEWEKSEKKYAEKKTIESEKKRLAEAEANRKQYNNALDGAKRITEDIERAKSDVSDIQVQIDNLLAKKALKEKELESLELREKEAHKWIKQNKNMQTEYDVIWKEYTEIQSYLLEQQQWEEVKANKLAMDEYESRVQQSDNLKDTLKKQLLDIAKKGLPDIEGLEVVTESDIDGKSVGVYLNDRNLSQLSESELWGLFLRIWDINNVRFVVIDNVNSLGSNTISILNELANNGVTIFATQMDRSQKELKITISEQIS